MRHVDAAAGGGEAQPELEVLVGAEPRVVAADREQRGKSLPLMLGAHKAFGGIAVHAARRPEGAVLRLSGQPVTTAEGCFAGFRGTGVDITDEYHREEETARLARYDSLTGLSNRHRMAHQIDATLTAFKAAQGEEDGASQVDPANANKNERQARES